MTTTGDYGIGGARLGGTHTPSERAAGAVGAVERAVCERSRVRVHVVRSVRYSVHVSCMHSRERNHFSARLSATVRLRFDIYTRRRQTTMSDRDRMTLDPHTPLSRVSALWARRRHMITKRSLARPTSTPRRRRNGTRSLRSLQRPPLHSASAAVRGCPATQEEFAWTGDAAEEMSIMRQKLPAALAVPSAVLDDKSILMIGGEQRSDSGIP